MSDFITKFTEVVSEGTEVPEAFSLWTALVGAGAALGRKVWIRRGHFTLYPNLYVVLVAGAGGRKSTPIGVLRGVVDPLDDGPNVTSQGGSPQGLIKDLSEVRASGTRVTRSCEGLGLYPELGDFLTDTAHKLRIGELLCDLYDCVDRHRYRTLGSLDETLENVFFSLLGASTEKGLTDALHPKNIGGGLTSRIVFVTAPGRKDPVPDPPDKGAQVAQARDLYRALLEVEGEITFSPEAKALYDEEYVRAYWEHPFREDEILGGYLNRRGNHLSKVAGILSVAKDRARVISPERMAEALTILESAEDGMPRVISEIGSSPQGRAVQWVGDLIRSAGKVPRARLTKRVSRTLSSRELDGILGTLVDSGQVKEETSHGRGRAGRVYVWMGPGGEEKDHVS